VLSKDGFISHLTYLVQLPYLGKSQNTKMTNIAVNNILFCEFSTLNNILFTHKFFQSKYLSGVPRRQPHRRQA